MKRLPAIALATMLLASCATSPTGRSQLMLVSGSQMSQLGLDTFNQMRKQGKFADAPRERAYAACVAHALIGVLPPPWNAEKWDVEIINDDSANAFALPGGRIGVNRGLFKVAKTPAQLAAVLGHELAHVVARHPAERVSDNLAAQIGVSAANAYGVAQGMNPRHHAGPAWNRRADAGVAAILSRAGKRSGCAGPALHGASGLRPASGGHAVAEHATRQPGWTWSHIPFHAPGAGQPHCAAFGPRARAGTGLSRGTRQRTRPALFAARQRRRALMPGCNDCKDNGLGEPVEEQVPMVPAMRHASRLH
jgi:hypothetical protein